MAVLAIDTDFESFIAERRASLDTVIERVTILARQGELPQVRLDGNGLVISPLKCRAAIWMRKRDNQDENPVCRDRRRA